MPEDPRYVIARVVSEYVTRDLNADQAEAALAAAGVPAKAIRQALRGLDTGSLSKVEAVALLGG